jgi:hypothetical protein
MRASAELGGRRTSRRARLAATLAVLLVVGLPATLATMVLSSRAERPVPSGAQPGGTIRGFLRDPRGAPLPDVEVRLFLVPLGASLEPAGSTRSAADGAFELAAPPLRGRYELRAGGGELRRVSRGFSFLDRGGRPVEPKAPVLELQPGCSLRVSFEAATARFEDSGRYELRATAAEGPLPSLLGQRVALEGEFDGARIEIGGLPPLDGELLIFFDNGDELRFPIRLRTGRTEHAIRL